MLFCTILAGPCPMVFSLLPSFPCSRSPDLGSCGWDGQSINTHPCSNMTHSHPRAPRHLLLCRSVFSPTLEPIADGRRVLIILAEASLGREARRLWVIGPGLAGCEAGSDSG